MLSILIPTYNYNTLPLVNNLYQQAIVLGIDFEIIVLDDASTNTITLQDNQKIDLLFNCFFFQNCTNVGRANNLNKLIAKAKYNWLLFLDCDMMPVSTNFLSNYKTYILKNLPVVFGGIAYQNHTPNKQDLLRWTYGRQREQINWQKRICNSYNTTLTSNILIKKSIFDTLNFNNQICSYGYEDLVFIQQLKHKNIGITHIDNACYHLNYESSVVFLKKTKKALETLLFIEQNNILEPKVTKLQKTYHLINSFKLGYITAYGFKKLEPWFKKNLLSNNPSLLVFDLYKLGYFCYLKTQ